MLWDIYALAIDNSKLSKETQVDKFLTYAILRWNVESKVVIWNHTRDELDLKYNVAYHVYVSDGKTIGINEWE